MVCYHYITHACVYVYKLLYQLKLVHSRGTTGDDYIEVV